MEVKDSDLLSKIQADRVFLQSVFDRVPGMIYIHDLVNDVNLYRSWTLKRILGYEETTVLNTGKGIRGLVHKDDLNIMKGAATKLHKLADNECVTFDYRMKHRDGQWISFRSEEYVYERDEKGRPTKCLGYAIDITGIVAQQAELDELNRVNQFLLKAAQILSKPDSEYKTALQEFATEVSLFLNAVCDISMLDTEKGIIRPEAIYHEDSEVRDIINGLFNSTELVKGEGLVGRLIESGQELFIQVVPEEMKIGPRGIDPKIVPASMMYVPLRGSQSVLGSLNLTRLEGQPAFTEQQADHIRRLGDYVALFVENGLLKQQQSKEVERRVQAEANLAAEKEWAEFKVEVSSVLADVSADLPTILQEFAQRVSTFFDVVCDIQLVDEQKKVIQLIALYHKDPKVYKAIEQHLTKRELKIGEGMVGKVVQTGEEFFVASLPEPLRKKSEEEHVNPIIIPTCFAYVPMTSHNRVVGTLDVTRLSGQKALLEDELRQIRDLAEHAAMIIENRVLMAEQKQEIRLRKRAEHKLERTGRMLERMEAETRSILNAVPIYISRISADLKYLFLNDTFKKTGMEPASYEGKSLMEMLNAKDMERLRPKLDMVLEGQVVNYDHDDVMADGARHYFNVALAPEFGEDGTVIGFYSCSTDITSRVEAEMAMKLTQDRFETLSLNSGDAFFFHDSEQNIIDVNQVASEMLGYSREELLTMKAHQIDPRWKKGKYQKYLEEVQVNSPQTFDTTVFTKNHKEIPVEVRFVKRREGRKTYIQSLIRDRTEKREQELRLQRSEERLRLIFDNVEDYIATVNADGVFESINKTTQGLNSSDVIGTTIFDFYNTEDKIAALRRNFERLKTEGKNFELEDSYSGPDGSTRTYSRKFIGIFHGEEFFKAILIIRDVTSERDREHSVMNAVLRGQEQERKRLGAELHDGIGQILSAIALQVSQIREEVSSAETDQLEADLEKLNANLQSAIREVRGISHDLMPEVLESFGLKEAVNQICRNLHDRAGIEVKFDHADLEPRYNPMLEVNLYRITQELVNNIQKHSECKQVFVSLMDHGDMLSLTVEDDGRGFDRDQDMGGIGLRNIHSRVSMMGGQIDVESAVNSGTLINIEVPKQ